MEMVILDENQNILLKVNLRRAKASYHLKKVDNIHHLDERTKKLLNTLDYYSVAVFSLINENNDFHISFMTNSTLDLLYYKLDDVIGVSAKDLFSLYTDDPLFLEIMKRVQDTNQPETLYFEYYNEDIFHKRLNVKFTKIDDHLYMLGRDETDYITLSKEQENLFENDSNAMAVIQNNKFVKVNKQYLKIFNLNSKQEIIGQKLNFYGLNEESIKQIKENFNNIIDGKKYSYSLPPIEINKNGKLTHFINLTGNYVLHEGKPAISLILYDNLKEELRKRQLNEKSKQALLLQEYMDTIETISKTCSAYVIDGNYVRSDNLYRMLERDPLEEDSKRDILWDIVLDEDRHILEEAYKKRTPENKHVDFTIRIKTAKGNIIYLKSYITDYYINENRRDVVSFYQDVTNELTYQKQLEKTLKDKEMLLTEVHHRVKNNLQIILSLINLNKNYGRDNEKILDDTETRIYAMALIHEKIYSSTSLSDVNMKDYIEELVNSLLDTYLSNIQFHSNLKPINLEMNTSIPLGLIVNELVINTIKYAFPNQKEGNLYINFKKEKDHYTLIIQDDGIGLPKNFDLNNLSTLGLMVVQNLVMQIEGNITILNCEGTGYKIEFKEE